MVAGCEITAVLVVREFDGKKNCKGVEEVERRREVGSSGKLSLFTDLLGDPICRVRHSPAYLMLVAEALKVGEGGGDKEESEIVGMIRGCIKSVTCGKKFSRSSSGKNCPTPIYTKLAYILGLRVSPSHRDKCSSQCLTN